jgi:hypothetical protein
MEKFNFRRSEKVLVWVDREIDIKVETLEEARVIAELRNPEGENVEWGGYTEVLWDTEEVMAVEVKKWPEEENVDVLTITFERTQ